MHPLNYHRKSFSDRDARKKNNTLCKSHIYDSNSNNNKRIPTNQRQQRTLQRTNLKFLSFTLKVGNLGKAQSNIKVKKIIKIVGSNPGNY